ncbi:hypothetical protein P43SY_000909 [Pythium insidiosum]|uniref:Uncharacterized protein n=1 Tax=Pythium insidiosum TaxID=114742 RepID=A0AAD5Q694_PYTIN|nr:hypothetical protein P43SY_000909 [Pythium insidiosum]
MDFGSPVLLDPHAPLFDDLKLLELPIDLDDMRRQSEKENDAAKWTPIDAAHPHAHALADLPVVFIDADDDEAHASSYDPHADAARRGDGDKAAAARRRPLAVSAGHQNFMMPTSSSSFLPHMSISSVEMQFGSPAEDHEAAVSPVSLLAFLQTTNLSFSRHLPTVTYVADRLASMGFENPMSLAFVQAHELAAAGIDNAMDQRELFQQARDSFSAQLLEAAGPPDLHTLITVSKWLTLCGIPRSMAVSYSALLQQLGYDSVQQFHDLRFDGQARGVFRPGHHHLFMFHLERVLSRSSSRAQAPPYYAGSHDREFDSTLLDELIPSDGSAMFGMSPAVGRGSSVGFPGDAAMYGSAGASDAQRPGSFTEMMQPAAPSSYRTLSEHELALLHDAVNLPAKTNPCRRGRRVEWNILASNGMNDPRFAALARYSAEELEFNFNQRFESPASGRSSEWTPQLVRLLWEVSQDARCKNGQKTMWEQIAQGRTGVDRYKPLSKFSNSQLRSRYRTEFGDKRPQSRKNRLLAAANAKKAAAQAAASGQPQDEKPAAKPSKGAKDKTKAKAEA